MKTRKKQRNFNKHIKTGVLAVVVLTTACALKLQAVTPDNVEAEQETLTTETVEVMDNITVASLTMTPQVIVKESEEVIAEQVTMFTTTRVHLRKSPSVNSTSITILNASELVTALITDDSAEWYEVEYNDQVGYIKAEYLKEFNPEIHLSELGLDYYHQDLVREMIDLFGLDIDEYFIYGMMYVENRFQNEPESSAGAQGILQIIPSTWKFLYADFMAEYPDYADYIINDPTDKTSNIILGMYCLVYLRDSYGYTSVANNADAILTSYNRGMSNATAYYKKHGTYSTEYSQSILRAADYIREHKTWKEGL